MKNLMFIIFTLLILIIIFAFIKDTFACELSIIVDKNEVVVGEEINVVIERVKTHKTCVLPIEETEIQIINGEIVKESEWVKGVKDTKEIVVKFNDPGIGVIKVIRDCPKGGLIVETKEFKVVANTTIENLQNMQENNNISDNNSDIINNNTEFNNPTESNSVNENDTTNSEPINKENNNLIEINDEKVNSETISDIKNDESEISKELEKYIFNPQTLLYIILIILSLIFISLKYYKLRLFTLLFSLIILGFYYGGCLCPISYIGKLFSVQFLSISFYIFLFLVIFISIITLLKGRVFCGYVCPHGALQEFIYKIKIDKFKKIEGYFKYLKYFVFLTVLILSYIYTKNYFCEVEPFKVLYNFSGSGFILIFAIIFLFLSIFIYRPFCRFICPFGAYLGLVAKFSEILHLRKIDITTLCITCKKCSKECNANSVYENKGSYKIDSKECFVCGDCLISCPKNK